MKTFIPKCCAIRLRQFALCLLLCAVSLSAQQNTTAANAVVPQLVNFSGVLTDLNGKPLTGVVGTTFLLYKEEQGGAPLWLETQNVQPDKTGHYTVMLGSTASTGLPADIFVAGEARWLGVQSQGQAEQRRVLLVSVPYALKAVDAQTIGGLPPSAFVLAAPPSSGGTPSSVAAATPSAPPPAGSVTGSGTVSFLPLWTSTSNIGNSVLFQLGTGSAAKLGINTTKPATALDVKGGSTIRGLLSLPATGVATATKRANSQPLDLAASAFNSGTNAPVTQTFQWQAEPTGNNTGSPSGTLNLLFGSGTSKPAETGFNIASNGQITFSPGQTFPGTGTITGVTAGTDLTGASTSGNVTLNLDTTKVPQLNVGNIFTADQSVTGNVTASGAVTAGAVNSSTSFNLGGNPFAFGSFSNSNAFLGFSGNSTTTGYQNTATGAFALAANSTGLQNTANGAFVLAANTTGAENTAIGGGALQSNTTGNNNTAIGYQALQFNTSGGNVAVGGFAGNPTNGAVTGCCNTFIGASANAGTGASANPGTPILTNATAIGYEAQVAESNAMVLGSINGLNGATADTLVGIGITAPTYKLHVGAINQNGFRVEGPVTNGSGFVAASFGGYGDFGIDAPGHPQQRFVVKESGFVGIGGQPNQIFTIARFFGHAIADGWDTYSSRRWKTNIQTLHGALAKVEQLRGVSYDLKESGKHEVGVIAEEVGAVVPEIVSWEKNGKDAQGGDYSRLTALLIEATKEQQALIRKQREQIKKQQRQMKAQQAQIETQEMQMKTQFTQIARLASQVTAIQTSLKARNAPSAEVQRANAQRPLLHQ